MDAITTMLMTDSVSWCASIVLLVQCSPTPSFISFNLDRVLENRGGGRDKMDKKVDFEYRDRRVVHGARES